MFLNLAFRDELRFLNLTFRDFVLCRDERRRLRHRQRGRQLQADLAGVFARHQAEGHLKPAEM